MAESEGAFRLTFVQGRGLLSLAGRDFEGLGRVDSLELEIPNLHFPFDLSGGVARFKNRRLRLRELALFVGSRELTGFLARAPLAEFGIYNPYVTVAGSRLILHARVQLGGHECEITAAARVSPQPPRSVGLCVYDVRAYGFLPIPAPLVVTALFTALGAESPATVDSPPAFALPPLLHIRSAVDIRIDVCELAMLAILPMHGWRLPERRHVQIRVAGGAAKATHVPLVFSLADPDAPADLLLGEDASPEASPTREFSERCAPIESALARGDIATALDHLHALAPLEADDRVGTTRLLQLLLAGQSTLAEAGELAQAALARWPEFVPALLALAVIASVRDQPGDAAVLFEKVAQLSAAQGRGEDESCALLAAARHLAASRQSERALVTLERVLVGRASIGPVARAKVMKQAVEGRWKEILATIGQESTLAEPDVRDEVAQVLELVHQGGLAKDTALVAQAAVSLEALLQRDEWPENAWSRAEAAYQMGLVRLTLGDDQAASHWFALCIEGDATGAIALAAWRALVELLHRRGDPAGVAQALAGWAGDARVSENAGEKIEHLVGAAQITWHDLRAPDRALSLLETALGLAPADENVLSELERLAIQTGHLELATEILRRHLRETRPDQGKAVLRVLIRLLVEAGDRQADAREACGVLLDLSPTDEEAVFHLARLGWDAGERVEAGAGYRSSTVAQTLSKARLAEAHLRTAQLAFAEGAHDEADRHLTLGLADEPNGARIEVLAEALRALGDVKRLHDLLSAREAALSNPQERRQVRRSLAAAAERQGDLAEAEAIYRNLLETNPDDVKLLDRMAILEKLQVEVPLLMPKEATDRLTQVHQRLGQVYLGLGDLQAARQNLELALASEPDRGSTLEPLATTYGRLGLHRDAAAMCERLSRVLTDPAKKAESLFRKGEILRTSLDDLDGANEAYLRASDLDPSFAPALGRLVTYYWSCADLTHLADIGADLVQALPIPKAGQDDLGLLVATAALLARHDEELAQSAIASTHLGAPLRPELAVRRLGELVARVTRGELGALDAVLAFVRAAMPPEFQGEMAAAAMRDLVNDPGDAGLAMVLARILEGSGRIGLARSAYCLAHFIDAGLGAGKRLAELGDATMPRPEAFSPGHAVHALCRGPLRKVLQLLARAPASAGPAAYDEPAAPLLTETIMICEMLRTQLGAPPIPIVAQGHGMDVTFTATQPLSILIGRRAESLAASDLRFFVARALEQARAGTLAVLRMSPDNLRGMLRAVLRVAGAPGTPFEIAEEAADEATALWLTRLRKPEIAALILIAEHKDELIADASRALANPPDLDDYIRGCRYTADRVGLLLCGRPLAVLRALSGLLKDGSASEETATVTHRQEQLRASQAMRELVAFMVSEEYAALVEGGQ